MNGFRTFGAIISVAVAASSFATGCSDGRPQGIYEVTSAQSLFYWLPSKSKFDFLLVIDNSSSMCEEQANLARNLDTMTEFLYDRLRNVADMRLAVVSTDLSNAAHRGRFLYRPAAPGEAAACPGLAPYDTADCPAGADPILDFRKVGLECPAGDDACIRAELHRAVRCRTTLGTGGDDFSLGLEAMRLGLSCTGPNAAHFGACCVDGVYDPECGRPEPAPMFELPAMPLARDPEPDPDFLRPDAVLVTLIISDADDCSDPAANPAASRRVICSPGGADDADGDGLPDGYADPHNCPDPHESARECADRCSSPSEDCDRCQRRATEVKCFVRDCGLPPCGPGQGPSGGQCATADECAERRCAIERDHPDRCEWFRSNLTPVEDYYQFLVGLKARPNEQLIVMTVTGPRSYTAEGHLITYNQDTRPEHALCLDASGTYDPYKACLRDDECPGEENLCAFNAEGERRCNGKGAETICCPHGACLGSVQNSCASETGAAQAGRRYLRLAELFDEGFNAGVGCPPGSETGGLVDEDGWPAQCTHICQDDMLAAFEEVRSMIAYTLSIFCLKDEPVCWVPTADGPRPCSTPEERRVPEHYAVRVHLSCTDAYHPFIGCDPSAPIEALSPHAYQLVLDNSYCGSGMSLELRAPPAPDARLLTEYARALRFAPAGPSR